MQGAVSRLLALRSDLLRHLRVPLHQHPQGPLLRASWLSRPFSSGTFLNKSDVTDRVLTVIKHFQKVDPSKVSPAAHFHKDLGLDSLDTVEVVMALEEEFALEIPDSEADKIDSCGAAIEYIAAHPMAK